MGAHLRVPNTSDTITPTVFRRHRDGRVVALFPYVPASDDGWLCLSFTHDGQHAAVDPTDVIQRTSPADPDDDEVWQLIDDLTGDPHYCRPIRVLNRIPLAAHAYRRSQAALGPVEAEGETA